jgi:hypothetical protein
MPGHFTHIHTARRVADLLSSGRFTDWPDMGAGGEAVTGLDPKTCGNLMTKWEKFTAIGAIGPDLFFFSQDWNYPALEPHSDDRMLALAVYYYFDAANEDDWEPILAILDGVNSTLAGLLRFVIKIQKLWNDFVDGWNKTVGPFADAVGKLADDLTGGTLSAFKDYLVQGAARQAGAAATPEVCGDHQVARKGLSGAAVQWLPVLRAGGGKPLVEPDGLVSVGPPRREQRYGQIDVGGAGGAQVRPARAGELGAELRVLGRRDVLRAQRVRAGDEAAIPRRARAGAAEHADEQGGDHCGGADREAARAGREIPDRRRPVCGEAVGHGESSFLPGPRWRARMTGFTVSGGPAGRHTCRPTGSAAGLAARDGERGRPG